MATIQGGTAPGASIQFILTASSGIFGGTPLPIPSERMQSVLTAGTAADKADGVYANAIPFSASTPQTIDLITLVDVEGNSITAARARMIFLKNLSTVDNDYFTVGNAGGGNEFDGFLSAGGTIKVFPSTANNDGFVVLSAPNTTGIPIGTGYNLKVDPGSLAKSLVIIVATAST